VAEGRGRRVNGSRAIAEYVNGKLREMNLLPEPYRPRSPRPASPVFTPLSPSQPR
jgi:hypothetical protein